MYYDPRIDPRPDPLTHNPLNALVAPRPIGWIGSLSATAGPNLAPFSYFNAFSADPPVVGFAPNAALEGGPKDTLRNVREIPEFTVSVVSLALAEAMNETSRSLPHGESEFEAAGLTCAPARAVRPPYVGEARAVLECTVARIIELPSRSGARPSHLVIGEVVGIYIDDALIVDGRIDSLALCQLGRLGAFDYAAVERIVELPRPG